MIAASNAGAVIVELQVVVCHTLTLLSPLSLLAINFSNY